MRTLKVALLGCGVVGTEVARHLALHQDDLTARIGARAELVGIAVRRADRLRPGVPAELVSTDAAALVARGDLDVVVEAIGGTETAGELIRSAIAHGASVVSANKALIAAQGAELHRAAREAGTDLFYEAAVGGAIPLLRPLRESLAGDRVNRVIGIVNGTTNFILDKMDSTGEEYEVALKEATALGYAEADPTADVEGHDAAAKAAILAGLAFNTRVTTDQVFVEGITGVTAADMAGARAMGSVVKLLAICERHPDGESVTVRVHPAMIPREHPLGSVRGAYNAVFVEADAAGRLMFYGPGAGGAPTASSVLGDLVGACRNRLAGTAGAGEAVYRELRVRPMDEVVTSCHIELDVEDRPGVLAAVATVLAEHGVSVDTVRQHHGPTGTYLAVVTHRATDAALGATVEALAGLSQVRAVNSTMRVESR
ncbi:homoserine dehydrogenase [Kitasatospora sp. NPDC015120]|uniref:homoserine dehydrogenase n=1 Tax=Kitasatospora sp. NPDC015120 TaxID=3364023 RepID=UPI0036F46997